MPWELQKLPTSYLQYGFLILVTYTTHNIIEFEVQEMADRICKNALKCIYLRFIRPIEADV